MKALISVIVISILLFGCGTKESDFVPKEQPNINNEANDINNSVDNNGIVSYPIELSKDEMNVFLSNYLGKWIAYEIPSVEEVSPGQFRYDSSPQELTFFLNNRDGTDHYSICYDVAPTLNGHWYEPIKIVREDDITYRIDVQKSITGYHDEWFDINYIYIINSDEKGKIQIKTPIRTNENIYFYSGDNQLYYKWLESKGYFVNGYNFESNTYINGRIWPSGLDNERVSLYDAKKIVEELGLVFETNIPEEEWNNPKPYDFRFIIDGEEYLSNVQFACKLGTTVYFFYY